MGKAPRQVSANHGGRLQLLGHKHFLAQHVYNLDSNCGLAIRRRQIVGA